MHNIKYIQTLVLLILTFLPVLVFASTGTDELTPALTWIQDKLNGSWGKLIVLCAIIVALMNCVIKFNGYVVLGCVAVALFALYGDDVLIAMFTAII